ncbi:hypothetical protein PR048_005752 [Dryococelus australis]|uniref:Uncharacterized protein n=1 Tax=Dryococelus australis TaxID=614101 RepID=A0ABQ9IA56_9NEOP|nr:hypothetical protein PR048_005752 [Dryococelus australis]
MSTNPDKTSNSRGHRLLKLALNVLHSNPEYVHVNESEDKGPKRIVDNSRHAKTLANRVIEEMAEEPSDVSCDDCDSYIPSSHESSDTDEHSVPDAQSFRTDLSSHCVLKTQSITAGNCSISTTQNGKTASPPQPSTSKNGNNPPASPTPPKNWHTHSAIHQHSPAKKRHISDTDTLNITELLVRGAFNKLTQSGFLEKDKRGRKSLSQKLTNVDEQYVRIHILSFPSTESHYCSKASEYKYLNSSLNVVTMYSLYKSKCKEAGKKPVGAEKYRQIFREYKIRIHKPKKNLCKGCGAQKEITSEFSQNYDTPYLKHLERKHADCEHSNED